MAAERNYSPHQQKIIKRYYENSEGLQFQKLSQLVGDLFLADAKKQDRLWKQVEESLTKLEFPASRIAHLMEKRDISLLAGVLKEIDGKS